MRYTNPVFESYFADPFVWRAGENYFAVGTGPEEAEGAVHGSQGATVFPLLRSSDLVHWHSLGRALVRPEDAVGNTFWAPEVAYSGGRWYIYYSVGKGDKEHQLRVGVSDSPEGPYGDSVALTHVADVPFAIDPHPFQDEDGRWYLFHARDFLDEHPNGASRAGTALVVHELETMRRLSSEGHTVLRARHDWQRFAAKRSMYGRILDWHTLEGPCVLKVGGRYYCLYSGGCWQTDTYGVDYAVAGAVLGPWDDPGGEVGPRVLRTVPGRVIGPGHCSVVLGPDGATRWIVYHAWDERMRARTMRLDELYVGAGGPRSTGPSWSERESGSSTNPAARTRGSI